MFVSSRNRGCSREGLQVASGDYLMLFNRTPKRLELRAAVRFVALKQLGHFMMGDARIGEARVVVSGPFGEDGLPLDGAKLPDDIWSRLVPVPEGLAELFWKDDSGNDGPRPSVVLAMRKWAADNMPALRKAGTKRSLRVE